MSNFHTLEVVDRGSETQLQFGENLNQVELGKIQFLLLNLPRKGDMLTQCYFNVSPLSSTLAQR